MPSPCHCLRPEGWHGKGLALHSSASTCAAAGGQRGAGTQGAGLGRAGVLGARLAPGSTGGLGCRHCPWGQPGAGGEHRSNVGTLG